ncbi:hypothetical protein MMC27_004729 [Xylographa pallens]|nr:hypothetical protein [Xylographa pallens]
MTSSSPAQNRNLRQRLYKRLNRLRSRSRDPRDDIRNQSPSSTEADLNPVTDPALFSGSTTSTARLLPLNRVSDLSREPATTRADEPQIQPDQSTLQTSDFEKNSANRSTIDIDIDSVVVYSDLWSAAYREAVHNLGKDIDVAILKGKNVAQLFTELEEIDKEATQESVFLRGVKYLHSIQVPLERFKLALDLASPLTSIEPTATTVLGVVRCVTAIAISFASADLEFAKQIGEMLEQISYIDDCDTLGQKTNKKDIHKALVSVYQKILEFYKVAFEILTRKGAKLVMKIILENDRLPNIVQDFLRNAGTLRKVVQKATLEIVVDIKTMLYDHEIARWLGSDKISRQSQYHAYLQDLRADQACKFLLVDANFINWYDASDSQQLVILGDMGCGKSVAMAFLVDELIRRNKHQLPQPKICYYYCQDDETGHAIHIFSALTLALLEQLSGLKKTFYEWYKQNQAAGFLEPATNIRKLEEFLQKVLGTLDRPLFVVIDGLDECDRASRNSLLKLLKVLSQETPRLKVILSTRPQEEILEQLDEMARIELGSDIQRDGIIVKQTVERQLYYLSEDVRALVIDRTTRLAQGSAIWTRMVVELIEVRGIRALGPMQLFLEEIPLPRQLSKLYFTLLTRSTSNDSGNQELASNALKILAVARRPLSILELAWAVALSTAQQKVTTAAALDKLVDNQRLMSMIQPFITRIDFNNIRKRQVRLIHQSVKEFIIAELTWSWPSREGLIIPTATDQASIDYRIESLEMGILNICIRYLLLNEIGNTDLFSEEQVAIEELPQEIDLFDDHGEPVEYDPYCTWETFEENTIRYDPTERGFGEFFVYASCYWLEHFGAITVEPFPDLASIESLCQAGSTRLYNWTKQNCRSDCAIKARFPFDSVLYDPLSVTALYGSKAMLHNMLKNSDFDMAQFLPRPATGAADQVILWGDLSRLRILFLEDKFKHELQNLDFFRLVLREWSGPSKRRHGWELVFDLVDHVSNTMVQEQWGNELLCMAASAGCIPIIKRLMIRAQHQPELRTELLRGVQRDQQPPSFGKSVHQSIGEAVLGNHVDVVEYLLGEKGTEAHLQHLNSRGENVLHLASRLCNPAMFRLLVPHFQGGMRQTDAQGDTVLVRIITSSSDARDRCASARILLLQGNANSDSRFWTEQQDPLRIAVRLGDLDMCHLLISIGKMCPLTAMTRDHDRQMVLKDTTSENQKNGPAILQLLRTLANVASKSADDGSLVSKLDI